MTNGEQFKESLLTLQICLGGGSYPGFISDDDVIIGVEGQARHCELKSISLVHTHVASASPVAVGTSAWSDQHSGIL